MTPPATPRSTFAAALSWRDFIVSDYSDQGQVGWLQKRNIDLLAVRAGSPVLVSSRWRACDTRPGTWLSQPERTP